MSTNVLAVGELSSAQKATAKMDALLALIADTFPGDERS